MNGTSYSYDANGNLTAAGSDTFSWDAHNQLTSATVNGSTTDYGYDGTGNQVSRTSNGTTTTNLWDGSNGMAQLVDDGSTSYVQANGAQEAIASGNTTSYPLTDALGSVRGVTDGSGTLTGSTNYDAFGAVRSQTGASLALGYTGQLTDPSTGFIDLRARQLDPTLGRFLSADTVQPNAPGSQGYNLYAYTANNPTTWTDLSGNSVSDAVSSFFSLATACRLDPWCAAPLIDGLRRVSTGEWLVQAGGFVESVLAVVACALTSTCLRLSQDIGLIVSTYGGGVDGGGGNRPPSPATCIRDAVKGLATGGVPGAIHSCANAIRENVKATAAPDQAVPIIEIDACRWPEAAQHIQEAQAEGKPSRLTIERTGRAARNEAALAGYPIVPGKDRDEYPPAMFAEGGANASVKPIDPHDNRGVGAYIKAKTQKYPNGTVVEIRVIPCH